MIDLVMQHLAMDRDNAVVGRGHVVAQDDALHGRSHLGFSFCVGGGDHAKFMGGDGGIGAEKDPGLETYWDGEVVLENVRVQWTEDP